MKGQQGHDFSSSQSHESRRYRRADRTGLATCYLVNITCGSSRARDTGDTFSLASSSHMPSYEGTPTSLGCTTWRPAVTLDTWSSSNLKYLM
jgi:hypothetical protein